MTECNLKKTTKEFLQFDEVKIEKMKFYCVKEVIDVINENIKKIILVSDE